LSGHTAGGSGLLCELVGSFESRRVANGLSDGHIPLSGNGEVVEDPCSEFTMSTSWATFWLENGTQYFGKHRRTGENDLRFAARRLTTASAI